jgi:type I restriction enzyme, S subunit
MEVKAGYKQSEIGVIPEEWKLTSLGKCLAVRPSYGINAPAVPYSDKLPVYIRITDITEDGRFMPDKRVSVKSEGSGNYYLSDGDLVFARTGASVGKSYRYNPNDGPLVYAGFLIRVRPDDQKLLPAFAAAYVTTGNYWRWVRMMSMRSGQPGINGNEYCQLPIPLPPLPEQHAIAVALSDVDGLLVGLDRVITKKRDLKQAAIQQLLTGQTRLPGFHGEWQVKRLGDVATIKDGTHQTPKYVNFGVPFYSVEHVTSGDFTNTKFISEEEHRFLTRSFKIEKGDILMTRIGSIGDCKLINWDVDASFYVSLALLKIRSGYSAPFIAHYSNTAAFKKEIELNSLQSAIPKKINLGQISRVRIELPPTFDEQAAIAEVLTDIDAELETLEQRREKTRALKQAMMQELLTGKTRLV